MIDRDSEITGDGRSCDRRQAVLEASSKGGKLYEPVPIVSHLVDDGEGGASHSWRDVGGAQCLAELRSGVLAQGQFQGFKCGKHLQI